MQEVIGLVKAGKLKPDSQAGRCVGYRQALEFLQTAWGFPRSSDSREEDREAGKPYSLKVRGPLELSKQK